MTKKHRKSIKRKPRIDALRNRVRIVTIAKEIFTNSGANASLDEIAKKAGVGPGTLYRHFPTRDTLLEAVYHAEVEKLALAEKQLSETFPPIEALRAWMIIFIDYVATKQIIAPALNSLVGEHSKVFEASYEQIWKAVRSLVKRAVDDGDLRNDIDPIDLLRALVGFANVPNSKDWQQSAKRLVDILIAGSRLTK